MQGDGTCRPGGGTKPSCTVCTGPRYTTINQPAGVYTQQSISQPGSAHELVDAICDAAAPTWWQWPQRRHIQHPYSIQQTIWLSTNLAVAAADGGGGH